MVSRVGFAFTLVLAALLAGCGGKSEAKKNVGPVVNTPPTGAANPGAGATPSGEAPANSAPVPPPLRNPDP